VSGDLAGFELLGVSLAIGRAARSDLGPRRRQDNVGPRQRFPGPGLRAPMITRYPTVSRKANRS
jgi:hypothetical protein